MRIGELARRVGLNASALRYYERLGLLKPPARAGGKRIYDPDTLTRLGWIRLGAKAGFTLRELRGLLQPAEGAADRRAEWRAMLRDKREELGRRAAELRRMRRLIDAALACGCTSLAECAGGRAAAVSQLSSRSPSPPRLRSRAP
jgi:MerR family redox-sensitive transcriptional activator SoxR